MCFVSVHVRKSAALKSIETVCANIFLARENCRPKVNNPRAFWRAVRYLFSFVLNDLRSLEFNK